MRYHASSRDAYLIELPTTITVSGEDVELWSRQQVQKVDVMDIDKRFWFCSMNGGLRRQTVEIGTNPYVLGTSFFSYVFCIPSIKLNSCFKPVIGFGQFVKINSNTNYNYILPYFF